MKPGQDWSDLVDQLAAMRQRDPDATLVVVTLSQLSGGLISAAVAGCVAGALLVYLGVCIGRLLS